MAAKSMHGLTRGTPLKKKTAMLAQDEAKGVMMYYSLARLAKEQSREENRRENGVFHHGLFHHGFTGKEDSARTWRSAWLCAEDGDSSFPGCCPSLRCS